MVDMSVITGAISGLRAASGIASDLVAIRDQAVLQSKVIELQRIILDAQSGALSAQGLLNDLQEQVRLLKSELANAAGWDRIAERYRLCAYDDQKFVYALKPEFTSEQPAHLACTVCFLEKKLSILQKWNDFQGKTNFFCQSCKNEYWLGQRVELSR